MELAYSNLVAWILTTMFSLQPAAPWTDTYPMTAEKIAEAAFTDPLMGKDGPDVLFTASLMTVWASHESSFKPDAIGDSGGSLGLFQVNPSTAGEPKEKLLDVEEAPLIALRLFHTSFRICKSHPVEERMAQYAYGRDCEHRLNISRARIYKAKSLMKSYWEVPVERPAPREISLPVTQP